MDHIRETFTDSKRKGRPVLVTFVTAGFPTPEETPDIMLGLQAGGADIIELGLPFTDAVADGTLVQQASMTAIKNGVTVHSISLMVQEARNRGLHIPILFMGYYNPIYHYGEANFVADCSKAGVDGFIVVDLPVEDAVRFRNLCVGAGCSYIPIIAPCTPDDRIKLLCCMADSFVYLVSRMGVTGMRGELDTQLPGMIRKVKKLGGNPRVAVGFGIESRDQFLKITSVADGAIIGSCLLNDLARAPSGKRPEAARKFCLRMRGIRDHADGSMGLGQNPRSPPDQTTLHFVGPKKHTVTKRDIPGPYGGQYVPEAMVKCLSDLESSFRAAVKDPQFWKEYESYYSYVGRPSGLHKASRLSAFAGGATIWLKREDLNHTGSHNINNALGQVLLARRLGKKNIIAETGVGYHGLATAAVCAKLDMNCTIYMGLHDMQHEPENVFMMRAMGATVLPVRSGAGSMCDAIDEAFRACIADINNNYYVIGSAVGPHPLPAIVRTFQSAIGKETKAQFREQTGKLPDAIVACVGGGSNAVGMFHPFVGDKSVRLIGVEREAEAASLGGGSVGVLHGSKTYILQDEDGQIRKPQSIFMGMNYPGVGPELASWKDSGRATFFSATGSQVLEGFRRMGELEGIVPALESSHAIWGAIQVAKEMGPKKNVVLCVSGRGDKQVQTVAEELLLLGPDLGWELPGRVPLQDGTWASSFQAVDSDLLQI
ncbi:tryptophan synthase beta chain [Aspergillus sclerotioniger CBS 115572]|uniref:Tryptophan synthase n=1 Tax=Aspergillus sclerotioniger CBS 115572 TaxID=1450535 RepID=A0A317WNR1_9EURO|nr:tryptophan synthase beta chain [Aspergillus sclerotioniger CBS 115572]PWY88109.1 tryptophan synthase beta chain [Aspergillus sclerotioniger CBS 115572]